MKKKIGILTVGVILSILLITSSSTYAFWKWRSKDNQMTNVVTTIGTGFTCSADGGGNITEAEATLIPTYCNNTPYVIKRTITTHVGNATNNPVYINLWLKVNHLDSELANSQYFRYAVTDSASGCDAGNLIAQGGFKNKTTNDTVDILLNDKNTTSGDKTYYLYIWLDVEETNNATQNQTFEFELHGECDTVDRTPNAPDIVDGLIPVKLSNTGDTVTAVAENDPTWYDYDQKKWANAVLVKDNGVKTRAQNSVPNTVINQDDILAYYVWIPRYSYKVWQYTGLSSTGEEHTIDIKFIDTNTIETATANGQYHTHPAFWWDNDSDGVREAGEELAGIWVAKFEPSHETITANSNKLTINNLNCTDDNCPNADGIRILPNVYALRTNSIGTYFYAFKSMQKISNSFGLSSESDSHIIKDSEWGAIMYLMHSKYGINTSVKENDYYESKNRYYLAKTGCGFIENFINTEIRNICTSQYGSSTVYLQSTSGNVTGVFDMVGGNFEYAMGNNNNNNSNASNSAFLNLPERKYYDLYQNPPFNGTYSTNINNCTFEYCGGRAYSEIFGWYSPGIQEFPTDNGDVAWSVRSSYAMGIDNTFISYCGSGAALYYINSRPTLIALNN